MGGAGKDAPDPGGGGGGGGGPELPGVGDGGGGGGGELLPPGGIGGGLACPSLSSPPVSARFVIAIVWMCSFCVHL